MKCHRKARTAAPRLHSTAQGAALACLSLLGTLHGLTAHAQTTAEPPAAAGSTTLETITVTARKRDELLIDVPISIQAFSEKTLRATGTYDLQDLKSSAGFTLNAMASTTAGGRTLGNLTFRGLQGDSSFLPSEVSGGVFLDGIYVSTGVGSINFRDAARVEVLKGPQNAFFGRNTFGGAINIVTRNPSSTFRGEANASFSQLGSTDVDATLEGPLVSELMTARLTLASHHKAAPYRATDGGPLGEENTVSAAGTLYITPNDKLWIRLRGQYQQDDDSMPAIGYLKAGGNTSCAGRTFNAYTQDLVPVTFTPTATGYFCGSLPSFSSLGGSVVDANTIIPAGGLAVLVNNSAGDPIVAQTPHLDHGGMRRNVTRASFQLGYQLPYGADLAFNLGYNKANSTSIWDLDHTSSTNYLNGLGVATNDLTADARISSDPTQPLRGLVGVSTFKQKYQFGQLDYYYGNVFPPFLAPFFPVGRDPNNYIDNRSEVPAIYGSLEYDILKELTVSGDVRYQSDHITSYAFNGVDSYSNTVKNWLPRVALRFKPMADTTVYGTVGKGVQQLATNSGYINGSAAVRAYIASQVPGSTEYTPQPTLTNYEIGLKQALFGNKLQYALALYQEKWTNRLTNTVLFCPTGVAAGSAACPLTASGTSVAIGNDATIKGIEFSVDAVVSPQWSFGGYIDYKQATYDKDYNASLGGVTGTAAPRPLRFDGNKLPRVPALTGTANATFRTPVAAGWGGYVRSDLSYTGRAWDSDLNIVQSDAYFRLNLRLGVEKGDTTVELFVKNLLDDKHWDYAHRVADQSGNPVTAPAGVQTQGFAVQAPPRRELGMRLRYAFN